MIHHKLCPVCGWDAEYTHDCNVIRQRKEDFLQAKLKASDIHHATITDMAKRLEAAERDAARYRWLVDNCQECPDALGMGGQLYFGTYSGMDGIDFAIDAAMQESGDRRTPEQPE